MFSIHPSTNVAPNGARTDGAARPVDSTLATAPRRVAGPLEIAADIAARHGISSLDPLLASCRTALAQEEIPVAIVGRFKAGKSSFINDLTGRNLLPVGVVPVTTVITEIRFGPAPRAEVRFLDGRIQDVPLDDVRLYVSERENPENRKSVDHIGIELPELERFRGLKFVDTPGLESVLAHNTKTSLGWLPNVGLGLVAISVDPPLSQRDIELLKTLHKYTPKVSILLTKADLLGPEQRGEVLEYVNAQLQKAFESPPPVWAYSIHPGFEDLKAQFEQNLLQRTLAAFGESRRAIVSRKIETLLGECSDYLRLSLRSAELLDTERESLKQQVVGEQQAVADMISELRIIANHTAGGTRTAASALFDKHKRRIETYLQAGFDERFPSWTKSLARLLECFEEWLAEELRAQLAEISIAEQAKLTERLSDSGRKFRRYLQDFRDRLSERTTRVFGVPLRTTEVEFAIHQPQTSDIRIGQIFDRNWELLSPVVPVWLIKGTVRNHFSRMIPDLVYTNLSRLSSQWEEAINTALLAMEREAEHRLEDLMSTVERLIETGRSDRLSEIKRDLDRIASAGVDI
jgi:GTP-binding protein EngB required for normal cell division